MIPYNLEIAESNKFPVIDSSNPDPAMDPQWITYEEFVTNLVKDRGSMGPNLEHMVIGSCGESGELADAIKKHTIYGRPLDLANVVEELGDMEFYMAGLRQMLGISRFDTLAANVRKLQARYRNGYSDTAAIERADKQVQVVDVTSPEYIANNPPITAEQVAMVDEQAGIIDVQPWAQVLIDQYHPGKQVQAIAYTTNTATVLFVGDSNPYKLYKPKE